MKLECYITEEESTRCKHVKDAFSELYDETDILVLDAGRYGYVVLQYFKNSEFNTNTVFNNSKDLFEDLWENWLDVQLLNFAQDTPMLEMDYEDIFKCMPIDRQEALMDKRKYFADKAGICLESV